MSSNEISGKPGEESRESSPPELATRRAEHPGWVSALASALPFVLSGALFLSRFLALFAPLPLLIFAAARSRVWLWGAVGTNLALVWALSGWRSAAVYLASVGALSLSLPHFLYRKPMVISAHATRAVVFTLLHMILVTVVLGGAYCIWAGLTPAEAVRKEVAQLVSELQMLSQQQGTNPSEFNELKETLQAQLIHEFPSLVAVFYLVMAWVNLLLVLRFHRGPWGSDLGFLKHWKAPEWLIWPTIVAGGLLLLDLGAATWVGLNFFRFFMVVYAVQGLSVLAYLFDHWKIFGFLRSLGYILAIWPMMPLLLAIGFFDLWFDFRAKFRQS